jgi:hypothetical protein
MNQPIENTEQKAIKPVDYLRVSVKKPGDEEFKMYDIFMSAGLRAQLVAISQLTADTSELYSNARLQELMIVECLAPRTARGQPKEEYTLEDFELSVDEGDKIVEWAIEHILSFFTNAVLKLKTAAENPNSHLMTLAQSLTGLQNLQVKKPSAGDSTAE